MTRRSRIERAEEREGRADVIRAARRDGNERRERNALVHMLTGEMRLDLSPHGMGRRGAGVAGNGSAYCWVSTLHRLERKRQVERLKGGRFVLTENGRERAEWVAAARQLFADIEARKRAAP